MLVRRFAILAVLPFALCSSPHFAHAASTSKPKLVVAIIIDQFRYDYLTRFRDDYHGGLSELMTEGADFTNAFYDQIPTKTAVGHSIFLSGAMPSISGIIDNAWYDRDEKKVVTSVCDWTEQIVGGHVETAHAKCTDADPASPRRLLVSTVGDELRTAHSDSKVVGVSLKARAAILPSGHRAEGAFWFDDVTGNFVTSTFYMKELPSWVAEFNGKKLPEQYVGRKWDGFPTWSFRPKKEGSASYEELPASPWGNELVERFAEQSVTGEKLGQRGVTDLLTVSFSSNDYVGHRVGPDAPEVRDMAKRTDQQLGKLFEFLDHAVGRNSVLVVLSADHGVASTPAAAALAKMPGGYLASANIDDAVESALTAAFGASKWLVPGVGEGLFYFDRHIIASARTRDGRPVLLTDVFRVVKEAILSSPQLHVARIYSRDQLENGVPGDFIARAAMDGFNSRRSGDLAVVFEPGFVPGNSGANHFSPYAYDRHVPVLFKGAGIRPGVYNNTIAVNDIAPTLATILAIQTPSGSSGRVLTEALLP